MADPSGNSSFGFPRISMFPPAAPRRNIEILGKQNELFPSVPVITCLLGTVFALQCSIHFSMVWKYLEQNVLFPKVLN